MNEIAGYLVTWSQWPWAKAGSVTTNEHLVDLREQSFAEWYLDAIQQYDDECDHKIHSVVPLTAKDVELFRKYEIGM